MSYIEENLGKDERILTRVTHSKAAIVSFLLWMLFELGITLGLYFLVGALGNLLDKHSPNAIVSVILYIAQIIVLISGIITMLFHVISDMVQLFFNQLVVTNKRLLGRKGFISKTVIDIPLTKIDNIQVRNGIFGALLHYGSLEISSAGSQRVVAGNSVNGLLYEYVKNTEDFRRSVIASIDKAKEEEREAQAEAQAAAMQRVQERNQTEGKS